MNAPLIQIQPREKTGLLIRLADGLLSLAILAGLAGLGWWGHSRQWTFPKFSSLNGGKPATEEWCATHAIAENDCVECNLNLMPKPKEKGVCATHGVAECPWENPELSQLKDPKAASAQELERVAKALALGERATNNSKCKTHLRRIQLASLETVEKAGIEVEPVWRGPVEEFIQGNGEITYDQTRVARLVSRVNGAMIWVGKNVGDEVKKGDLLALVDSVEIGKAKSEYLQAQIQLGQRARVVDSVEALIRAGAQRKGSIPDIEAQGGLREAEVRLLATEQTLLNLGFPVKAEEWKNLKPDELRLALQFLGVPRAFLEARGLKLATSNLFPILAPQDGVVVAREVVAGETVDTSRSLFTIADLSRMWLQLEIRGEDVERIKLGQTARFSTGGKGAKSLEAPIDWISTAVDEKTRTLKIRATFGNPGREWRAFTFGTGKVIYRQENAALQVPSEAVQWEGCCQVVFVRDRDFLKEQAPKVFHVRKVRLGAREGGQTEILAGVLPGELVATKGSGALRGELLKSSLGKG
ncbi:MAG: efflux RND transporter periplasmic adaptor subunit [Gemmataceae bacterium]|nr:efflux RND transporter periplasmic adaptor subunit [Gemmataceae bacterium]